MTIEPYPTPEQIQSLLALPDGGPVVMVNLLRYKPAATAPDEGITGEEAYGRYLERMLEYIQARGARVIWSGRVEQQVIGTGGEGFHAIALVEYPSRKAFFEIA